MGPTPRFPEEFEDPDMDEVDTYIILYLCVCSICIHMSHIYYIHINFICKHIWIICTCITLSEKDAEHAEQETPIEVIYASNFVFTDYSEDETEFAEEILKVQRMLYRDMGT
jgi:hypothetical protein